MNMNEFLSAKCEFAKTLLSRINLFRHGIVIAGGAVAEGWFRNSTRDDNVNGNRKMSPMGTPIGCVCFPGPDAYFLHYHGGRKRIRFGMNFSSSLSIGKVQSDSTFTLFSSPTDSRSVSETPAHYPMCRILNKD